MGFPFYSSQGTIILSIKTDRKEEWFTPTFFKALKTEITSCEAPKCSTPVKARVIGQRVLLPQGLTSKLKD